MCEFQMIRLNEMDRLKHDRDQFYDTMHVQSLVFDDPYDELWSLCH